MKSKSIFNIKQYYQSLNQMRLIGIISTIILAVISAIIPINRALSIKSSIDNGTILESELPRVVNYISSNTFLIITFIIVTPILTLYCWNFLTKRSSSDFYHSLPYTRKCSYISNVLAIVTWIVICLGTSMVVSIICNTALSQYLLFDVVTVLRMYLALFVANILCMGAITLACTITGTVFSNICVSGLIIFFVRFMILICTTLVSSSIPILSNEHTFPLLDNSYNVLTAVCLNMFTRDGISNVLLSHVGNIYTVLLGIIYIVIGGIIYTRRKSETAGKVAFSRSMQFIIRVVIGFTVCAFGIILTVAAIRNNSDDMYRNIFIIIVTFIVAALGIIIYECISTKTVRGIIQSIPSIIVTYAISIVFFFGISGVIDGVLNFRPSTNDLSYITLASPSSGYTTEYNDYFKKCSENIKIEKKEIMEIVCEALGDNVDVINQEQMYFYSYASNNELVPYLVKFKTGILSQYRTVYLTPNQMDKIVTYIQDIDEYKNAYLDLPDLSEASIVWNFMGYNSIDKEKSDEVYKMLLEESVSISFSDWYKSLNSFEKSMSAHVSFIRDGVVYSCSIPITDYLPKTKNMLFNKINEHSRQSDSLLTSMYNNIDEIVKSKKNNSNIHMNFEFFDPSSNTTNSLGIYDYIKKLGEDNYEIFDEIKSSINSDIYNKNYDFKKPYVIINYYEYNNEDNNYTKNEMTTFIVQLDGYNNISDYYN